MSYKPEITDPSLLKDIVELAKKLTCNLSKAEGYNVSEEKTVTKTSLSNMLKAARLAEEKNNYEIFEISLAYIARDTEYDDELNMFVRGLIRGLRNIFQKHLGAHGGLKNLDEVKIKIAKEVLRAVIMIFRGLEADIKIICKR